MPEISLDDQIACVRRELKMREQVYPRWVQQRRMHETQMTIELANMRAVLATLEGLRGPGPQSEMFGPGAPR